MRSGRYSFCNYDTAAVSVGACSWGVRDVPPEWPVRLA